MQLPLCDLRSSMLNYDADERTKTALQHWNKQARKQPIEGKLGNKQGNKQVTAIKGTSKPTGCH